jgi:phage terminase small subunit
MIIDEYPELAEYPDYVAAVEEASRLRAALQCEEDEHRSDCLRSRYYAAAHRMLRLARRHGLTPMARAERAAGLR